MTKRVFFTLPNNTILPEITADGALHPATAQDMPLITTWINAFYTEALNTSAPILKNTKSNDLNANAKVQLYIWWHKKKPTAMGALHDEADPETCRLNLIYTEKNCRNQGYGKALVTALAKLARDKGKIPILYTETSNTTAQNLYRSVGFIEK